MWSFVVVAVVSWVVAWAGDGVLPRAVYPWVLLGGALTLSVLYLLWLDVGFVDAITARWAAGVAGGVVAGAVTAYGASHLPVTHTRLGSDRTGALIVDGLVYGTGEGLLLSALPAYMTWQAVESLGWPGMARWTLPVLASVLVIVVHHLAYRDFRGRALVEAVASCGVLTLAFLLTGSVLAPVLGHVLLHTGAIVHGAELPPHPRPAQPARVPVGSGWR